jgi:hypothetical protein
MYIYIYTHKWPYIFEDFRPCDYTRFVYAYMNVYVYINVYMYTYINNVYIYICIYIYIQNFFLRIFDRAITQGLFM